VFILALKWTVLWFAGVLAFATWFSDFSFALLTFNIWAMTTIFKNQPLRLDGTSPSWEIVVTLLVVYLIVYLWNVHAWLAQSEISARVIASFLALSSAGVGVFLILGIPPRDDVRAGG